ncbi:hypothetical protein ACEPAF_5423 [Sanghuangporus sanghuang]
MVFISPRIKELRAQRPTPARTAYKLNPFAAENRAADESKLAPKHDNSENNGEPALTAQRIELATVQVTQVELAHPRPFRHMALREAISRFEEMAQSYDSVPENWNETYPEMSKFSSDESDIRPLASVDTKPRHVERVPVTKASSHYCKPPCPNGPNALVKQDVPRLAELDRLFPEQRDQCKARAIGVENLHSPTSSTSRPIPYARPSSPDPSTVAAAPQSVDDNPEQRNNITQDEDSYEDHLSGFDESNSSWSYFGDDGGSSLLEEWIDNLSWSTEGSISEHRIEGSSPACVDDEESYFGDEESNSSESESRSDSPFIPPRPSPDLPISSTPATRLVPGPSTSSLEFDLRSPRPDENISDMAMMWDHWMHIADEAVERHFAI